MESTDTDVSFHTQGHQMTHKQIRNVVTPFEFGVSDDLVGTALATPKRRGMAIIVDLAIVGFLTNLPGYILTMLWAVLLWQGGDVAMQSGRRHFRNAFRFVAVLFVLFGLMSFWGSDAPPNQSNHNSTQSESATLSSAAFLLEQAIEAERISESIDQQECEPVGCWQAFQAQYINTIETLAVDQEQQQMLLNQLEQILENHLTKAQLAEMPRAVLAESDAIETQREEAAPLQNSEPDVDTEKNEETSSFWRIPLNSEGHPSILAWIQGFAEDMGLGFGWAVIYFSAVTGWWKGQTVGKKLLGIQVLKLDGEPMTLWQSFVRYGGYGAGLTTGLLGFIQIYWDPNRQAIQDKISETLVIRLHQKKVSIQTVKHYFAQRNKKTETMQQSESSEQIE